MNSSRFTLACNMALVHHINSVTHTNQFGQLRGHTTALPACATSVISYKFQISRQRQIPLVARPESAPQVTHSSICQQHLLLVPAGKRLNRRFLVSVFLRSFYQNILQPLLLLLFYGTPAIEEFSKAARLAFSRTLLMGIMP